MKLEDQVSTLEQSQRLQELGITAESIFKWQHTTIQTREGEDHTCNLVPADYNPISDNTKLFPAYTVAELGEMLPRELHSTAAKESRRVLNSANDYVGFGKNSKGWFCRETEGADLKIFPTEAQARAAMLIYLLETGIINHEQIQS